MTRISDAQAREAHAKLWAKIEADGIVLRANLRLGSVDQETKGQFFVNVLGEPQIQLFRDHRADEVDDYEQELITLAHEQGHDISHRKGQRPCEKMPDPSPDLTPKEKQAIQDEEARAWRYGREVLVAMGVTLFNAFDKRKADADAIYLRRLGLAGDNT